ncbi:hypothetical protein [uncultured Microbulbifer sp.]|uniref:hypothetical protein n=1 Tax=uncultured Microbulbifer sp. TaxID=348147 RepID=UPI002613161D|nr:hypothetical protein [uncultured Microbulbifer sp.]
MQQDKFIQQVSRRLHRLFTNSKLGVRIPPVERHRLEGFMQAGVFFGFSSKNELAEMIENIHIDVFGKTIAERKAEAPASWIFEEVDYSQYDSPTYERSR